MYQVVVLGDAPEWQAEFVNQVNALVDEVTAGSVEVDWLDPTPLPDVETAHATVVVLLASTTTRNDPAILGSVTEAETNAFAIIPVFRPDDTPEAVLPDALRRLNAVAWQGSGRAAAWAVVRALGLAQESRRVFISYRRTDTYLLAEQLHAYLTQRGFDVFLDRFGVAIGDDFQRRIDIELASKSFVLVLESQNINESPWVRHEITYALAHGLGILGFTLPDTIGPQRVSTLDSAYRLELKGGEVVGGMIDLAALPALLDRIELEHSRLIRRRRNRLFGSLRDYLFIHGCNVEMVDEWALLASGPNKIPEVFSVTPVNPEIVDLYRVDQLRERVSNVPAQRPRATLVHECEDLDPQAGKILAWVGESRDLTSVLLRSDTAVLQDVM